MTTEELAALFEKYNDEFLEFERIENPAHRRPDVCAFIMLDAAVDKKNALGRYSDMVSAAEHDVIYLTIDTERLAEVATPELIRDLVRCGVRYEDEYSSLAMFV